MLGANRIQVTPHVSLDRIEYQTQEWEIGLFEMEPHYHLKILLVILARSPGPLPSKILQDSRVK